MKYMDKSFSVPMPGPRAEQWPDCKCGLEMGHKEPCRRPDPCIWPYCKCEEACDTAP